MKNNNSNWLSFFVIIVFVSLYGLTSAISMIHIVDFFELSNSRRMSWIISVAFEVGAAASLAALTILNRLKKELVIGIFVLLTALQVMGNIYYSYTNLELSQIKDWIELFGLSNMDSIMQKRIIAIVSGLPLPIIALGFIKSLVDYLKPADKVISEETERDEDNITGDVKEEDYSEEDSLNEPNLYKKEEDDELLAGPSTELSRSDDISEDDLEDELDYSDPKEEEIELDNKEEDKNIYQGSDLLKELEDIEGDTLNPKEKEELSEEIAAQKERLSGDTYKDVINKEELAKDKVSRKVTLNDLKKAREEERKRKEEFEELEKKEFSDKQKNDTSNVPRLKT